MNQDYQRMLLDGDEVGPARNPISTFFSHRISAHSDQERILIHDVPEIYTDSDFSSSDDDMASPLIGNCGYSRPFLFLDMIWNFAFVLVSVFVLLTTVQEKPTSPLRLWIFGYALQCLLHVGFVWAEYQSRSLDDFGGVPDFPFRWFCQNSIIQKVESINTLISSVWWVFGFYWIVIGGQPLLQDSPRLYWLSVVFLAFDVFFMIFCIAMASFIFLLLFCCFPILATVAYAMTTGEGASDNDIDSLPKFVYRQKSPTHSFENEKKPEANLTASSGNFMDELVLHPDDSECCICLYKYVDGTELCRLPCNHHFHHRCIAKWLRINATCPLCKLNILRGDMLV